MDLVTKAVLFAADDGIAMISKKSAALHKIIDKTVLEYMVGAIKKAGIDKICVVTSDNGRGIVDVVKDESISIVVQTENSITAQTLDLLEVFLKDCGHVVMLDSDLPLLRSDVLTELISEHIKCNCTLSCLSTLQHSNALQQAASQIINYDKQLSIGQYTQPQIYCVTVSKLNSLIKNNTGSQNVFYKNFEELAKSENEVSHYIVKDAINLFKIKSRKDLNTAAGILSRQISDSHINNGVTIIQPETTYIGADVEIGMDTVIYPGVSLEGKTKIGENCVLGYNSRIVNSEVSNDTEIFYSTILESTVGSNVHVGPYAFIRLNSKIGNNVKIGDFVEIKNSSIDDNTKASHLTYVGDADVGESVNFGCGTVLVNYDGEKKHRTRINDKAFIGCNSNLVSPIEIGKNAFIAAGSTITENVPENALSIARCRQTNKHEWRIKRNQLHNTISAD